MHNLFLLAVAAGLVSAGGAESPLPAKARILIVTGVDTAHDWKKTAPVVRASLERDPRIEARVVEDPEFLASPRLADYDAVLLEFMNPQPLKHQAQAEANLSAFVRGGKGLVVLHFACGALSDWPEFASLAGKVWDRKTTHDPRGPFTVKIVNREHPITRGMKDFQADDELYFCLVGERPVELLAVARSKVTGTDQPMAFAFEYGKGRVFHTPLGHDGKAIQMPGVEKLLQRGCLWAAGREP
jgi:type 1 glutamine amidotransferase